ncbi:MAG: metallophosphoesterase family protein [Stackebrandtia sp.]
MRRLIFHTRTLTAAAAVLVVATTGVAVAVSASADPSSSESELAAVPELDNQIEQLTEGGVVAAPVDMTSSDADSVCHEGAKWMRVRVADLDLKGDDSVTLSGSDGGEYTLTAKNWNGQGYYTRAFEGDCVSVAPQLSDPDSGYSVDAYQAGSRSLTQETVTVAGAGDICGDACNQTDDLILDINPTAVFTAGDNAYEDGTIDEFNANYDPTWGQFKDKTHPSPGNHEYHSDGDGYYEYFGEAAGDPAKGYYSWDVGDWHFVALNTEVDAGSGSEQEQWLRQDLEANTKPCTAAYTHHPRFSSSEHGDDSNVEPLMQALYDNQADIFVGGHDHAYERFAPHDPQGNEDAQGVRSFVIGTGGRGLYDGPNQTDGPSEVFNNDTFGVGSFELTATGYTMEFVPVEGRDFTDTISGDCHNAT